MRIMVVAGARPNFMKVAPILSALRANGDEALLVHTGQHYDAQMSDAFFRDLGIPAPDFHLGVGSGTHAEQTARIMLAFEPVLVATVPDWLVVVGDVNSTLACTLVGAKLRPVQGTRIAHVEAGLRSRDWRMPEEVNRVLTDQLADLLLIPSRDARDNLLREGIADDKISFAGNVMVDTMFGHLDQARELGMSARLGIGGGYAVVTLHRPSNVDEASTLRPILQGLQQIARKMPVVFPIHPRTRQAVERLDLGEFLVGLQLLEPLGYVEMLSLTASASVVITDSGGLQEETTALQVPCITLREQTERPVTVTEGTNRLAPWPLSSAGIFSTFEEAIDRNGDSRPRVEGWDGEAARRIVRALHEARR